MRSVLFIALLAQVHATGTGQGGHQAALHFAPLLFGPLLSLWVCGLPSMGPQYSAPISEPPMGCRARLQGLVPRTPPPSSWSQHAFPGPVPWFPPCFSGPVFWGRRPCSLALPPAPCPTRAPPSPPHSGRPYIPRWQRRPFNFHAWPPCFAPSISLSLNYSLLSVFRPHPTQPPRHTTLRSFRGLRPPHSLRSPRRLPHR